MDEDNSNQRMPRKLRTPITDIGSALHLASEHWVRIQEEFAKFHGDKFDRESEFRDFFSGIFEEMFKQEPIPDGDVLADKLDYNDPAIGLYINEVVCAYCVQAMKAENNSMEAWTYAVDAAYYASFLNLKISCPNQDSDLKNPASLLAKRRHAENYQLVEDAIKYWESNMDKNLSAQKAANELVRIVPLSHKKLAEIISKAKKDRS